MIRHLCISRLLVALAIIGLASGCSVFDVRDAEAPGGEGSNWQVPDVPQAVFVNMQTGLEDLTGVNYTRSLNDPFTFVPLQEDLQNPSLAGKFVDWTIEVETQVTERLVAESSAIAVIFTNITQIRDQSPFADFQADYELKVTSTATGQEIIYKAKAQFDMQEGSKGWQLVRWVDIERVSGFASWGFLRGSLRQTN